MRLALAALAVSLALGSPARAADETQDPGARILRAERWIKAAFAHQPGASDDAVAEVSLWSGAELRMLFTDQGVLAQLMQNPARTTLRFPVAGRRPPAAYTSWQRRRVQVLACVAAGALEAPGCADLDAENELDPTLLGIARAVKAASRGGDVSFVLKRGAVLHGDIAMFGPAPVIAPIDQGDTNSIRVSVNDGESTGLNPAPLHWEMARQLLDYVPPGDPFVSRWYVATAAWMQYYAQHDTIHLVHARKIFPDDPDVLFFSGCQQETYAGPAIQAIVRTAVLPNGFFVDVAKADTALRDAEQYFRRAAARRPAHVETRIRLAHVLLERGRPHDAAAELAAVSPDGQPDALRYFHALFTGAAQDALGNVDRARDAYVRASKLFPGAQSPYLALSALAMRHGDRAAGVAAMEPIFHLPLSPGQSDPWWSYSVIQARDNAAMFDALYRMLGEAPR